MTENKFSINPSLVDENTYRKNIKIPPIPKTKEELQAIKPFIMEEAEMLKDKLTFTQTNGFKNALKDGFFLVKIPDDINLESGDKFSQNFFKEKDGNEDIYKGYKNIKIAESYQGYFDREHDQWENFYIESSNWNKYLSEGISTLGTKMANLGIKILINVLDEIGVKKEFHDLVTGGLTKFKGHKMLAFNHFRANKETRGTKLHRDSGWITVLRSTEPGLIALIGEKLYAINPKTGYFIINFGSSIEVLTEKIKTKVRGNIHGVCRTYNTGKGNRTSYVIFLDNSLDSMIYKYIENKPQVVQSMEEFAKQEVSRTYNDNEYI